MDDRLAARLVDSHCHLDFPDFQADLDGVMERARAAGVGCMLTIGTHVTRASQVLAVAERFPNIFCTLGIHPHEAAREPRVTVDDLARLADHPRVVGLGETGLDYYYDHSPREIQQEQFRTHVRAARTLGLPLAIHTRDADDDMVRILREEAEQGAFAGLLHCFSSTRAVAETAIELGLYVSLSGVVTFKNADGLRAIVRDLPLDRLLVETDAPYLAPVPHRGKRNEPAYVAHTAARVAELKGMAYEDFVRATTANFFRLFRKAAEALA
ncbi:MAG: TatD family hydrolase [Magnetospirillum sp. WYHS-4]